jgi:hypothetical protein
MRCRTCGRWSARLVMSNGGSLASRTEADRGSDDGAGAGTGAGAAAGTGSGGGAGSAAGAAGTAATGTGAAAEAASGIGAFPRRSPRMKTPSTASSPSPAVIRTTTGPWIPPRRRAARAPVEAGIAFGAAFRAGAAPGVTSPWTAGPGVRWGWTPVAGAGRYPHTRHGLPASRSKPHFGQALLNVRMSSWETSRSWYCIDRIGRCVEAVIDRAKA